ncbi:MAG: protease inhibitor I42 family protein [Coriobacteriales bacterium]|jgi:predicted secreted protein|nr:protease inhibitor I42 family protein [Coriobacteriales bacterium]
MVLALLLGTALTATGCIDGLQQQQQQQQEQQQLALNQATVKLSGNPTTGYNWTYTLDNEGVVKELSNKYVEDPNPNNFDGVGGMYIFEFESVAKGETTISFFYARGWEEKPTVADAVYKAVVDEDLNLTLTQKS